MRTVASVETAALHASPLGALGNGAARVTGTLPNGSGVAAAVLSPRSGAVLAWRPLDTAELPATLRFAELPTGDLWLVLTHSRNGARYSYLQRTALTVDPAGEAEPAHLDLTLHPVRVSVAWAESSGIAPRRPPPLVLADVRRPDDPDWVAPEPGPLLTPQADGGLTATLTLAPGTYRITLDGVSPTSEAPTREVTVPDELEVSFALPRP